MTAEIRHRDPDAGPVDQIAVDCNLVNARERKGISFMSAEYTFGTHQTKQAHGSIVRRDCILSGFRYPKIVHGTSGTPGFAKECTVTVIIDELKTKGLSGGFTFQGDLALYTALSR